MGTPDFSTTVLEMLIAEHDVIAVVTQPDRPVGRKRVMTPPPVKKVAMKYDLPVYQPEKLSGSEELEQLLPIRCRFNCNCCFWTVPESLLALPKLGAINVHASLLPKYREGSYNSSGNYRW
ncbi:methionyl-tRNA formyltransferase [Staphylococcus aureus]